MTTRPDAGDDLLAILSELDALISGSRTMPMSASVIVNREEALDLVERARQAVPGAVRRAEDIVADADAVAAQGRQESERLVSRAHEEAERLVSAENVVRQANDRADAIIAAAEEKAAQQRHGADDYSDRTLAALEIELGRIGDQVRAGREVLAGRLQARSASGYGPGHTESERSEPTRRSLRSSASWSVDPSAQR
ncbi:ATPase [Actinomyces faecalis]|uniref:ATPase n=1 Tax=Actinomyces faecalis TaxID=2722820 RepID=UPI0015578F7C|nr:ATPase [Actinomyces faecalis]